MFSNRINFLPFQVKRIGLITNQTGVDRFGKRNVDVMRAAGVNVAALFSPEHGFAGVEDHDNIGNAVDTATGIKVWSLYGKTLRPTPEMLRGLDALVFDIQDVGARFYTYESTMIYAMEEAAKANLPFYVLDRPNPITGIHVEGPMLDPDKLSFTGSFPLPLRHGMTMGELAKLVNGEKHLNADLHVIEMTGWNREDWFDSTGLPWVNPRRTSATSTKRCCIRVSRCWKSRPTIRWAGARTLPSNRSARIGSTAASWRAIWSRAPFRACASTRFNSRRRRPISAARRFRACTLS